MKCLYSQPFIVLRACLVKYHAILETLMKTWKAGHFVETCLILPRNELLRIGFRTGNDVIRYLIQI